MFVKYLKDPFFVSENSKLILQNNFLFIFVKWQQDSEKVTTKLVL